MSQPLLMGFSSMKIAARIRQIRFEHSLSLEDLAATAGLGKTLLASFVENGQRVPSWQALVRLAEALGVPFYILFYANLDSLSTPWLTPRPTSQQLMDESCRPARARTASRLNPRALLGAVKGLLSFRTKGKRGQMGTAPKPTIRFSNPS